MPGKPIDPIDPKKIPLAMPDEYKIPGDPVASYRAYYVGEKLKFATWRHSEKPEWI
jgi:hypothetical protein